MDMRTLVGENVKRLRQRQGVTQGQFAERSGFSRQYLSDLERGKRNPTIVSPYEIAQALTTNCERIRPWTRIRRTIDRPSGRVGLLRGPSSADFIISIAGCSFQSGQLEVPR